ncbi:MAG: ribonuclease domain-containing protein [Anaeromyxobacter sp.]
MKRAVSILLGVLTLALGAGRFLTTYRPAPAPQPPAATLPSGPAPQRSPPLAAPPPPAVPATPALVVRDVEVRDLDGRVAWRGDVDLAPVLARIERGERDPHRDDGTVFQNREGRLPGKPRGYWHEYVVRTPGLRQVGPQRLVLGDGGEAYYTSDHYRSFRRVR